MATMHDGRDLIEEAFAAGADVYLVKPHGFMELFKRLKETGSDMSELRRLIIDQFGPRPFKGPSQRAAPSPAPGQPDAPAPEPDSAPSPRPKRIKNRSRRLRGFRERDRIEPLTSSPDPFSNVEKGRKSPSPSWRGVGVRFSSAFQKPSQGSQ